MCISFEPSLIKTDAITDDVVMFATDIPTIVSLLSAVNKVAAEAPKSFCLYRLKFCAILFITYCCCC